MEVSFTTNEINNYSVSELNYIRDTIENMNKFNQVEILRILNTHDSVTLNENKYGIHINLSELDKDIINELSVYINYVITQEKTLNLVEKQKEEYKNTYFTKDIKDNNKLFNSK
jgi:hypothetical protein